jgi:hypothetical protein
VALILVTNGRSIDLIRIHNSIRKCEYLDWTCPSDHYCTITSQDRTLCLLPNGTHSSSSTGHTSSGNAARGLILFETHSWHGLIRGFHFTAYRLSMNVLQHVMNGVIIIMIASVVV